MAIGVDQIYLSMKSPDTGAYLTADVYTVEGVTNADGSPRLLSIGQLVMALCLKRAHDLEMGYDDSITGQHVDGVLEIMNSLETNTEILECLTKIETDTLDGDVNLKTRKLWYQGVEMFMGLRRLGKPAWLLQYNNEAHNLRERRNRKDLTIRLQQFFDHYLKGAPEPAWMRDGVPSAKKEYYFGYEEAR